MKNIGYPNGLEMRYEVLGVSVVIVTLEPIMNEDESPKSKNIFISEIDCFVGKNIGKVSFSIFLIDE